MENIFNDLDASLNYVLTHVGQTGIRRRETTYSFGDFGGLYSICLTLMLEKGARPECREALDKYYLVTTDTAAVRNYLYTSGAPAAYAPVKPGCLIGFTTAPGQENFGLVLETDNAGQPLKTVVLEGSSVETTLAVKEALIPVDTIFESFEISADKRQWSGNSDMASFYGNWKALELAINLRQIGNRAYTFTYSGKQTELQQFNPVHLLILLGLESPAWMLERIMYCCEWQMSDAILVFNTLGKGWQPYRRGLQLAPGTVLFTADNKTGVVLTTDTNGLPAMMMEATNDNYYLNPYMIFTPVDHDQVASYWEPATSSYNYVPGNAADAFTDKNIWIGKISLLGSFYTKNKDYGQPLFKNPYLLDRNSMSDALQELLKNGPAEAADWKEYLKPYGQGLQAPGKEIAPGDFIFYKGSDESTQTAIALPGDKMVYTSYDEYKVAPVANVEAFWKPSARK